MVFLQSTIIPINGGFNISLIYDGTIPFQYLKTVVAMQDSALLETDSQYVFSKWVPPMWERWGTSKQRRMHLICIAFDSFSFIYLLKRENHGAISNQNVVELGITW